MNKNCRLTINTNQNIVVEFTNERIIPAGGLAVVGALLGKCDFIKKINRMDVTGVFPSVQKRTVKKNFKILFYGPFRFIALMLFYFAIFSNAAAASSEPFSEARVYHSFAFSRSASTPRPFS